MTEKEELKPCPFCREAPSLQEYPDGKELFVVWCNHCNAGTALDDRITVIKTWNYRAPSPLEDSLKKRIGELSSALAKIKASPSITFGPEDAALKLLTARAIAKEALSSGKDGEGK